MSSRVLLVDGDPRTLRVLDVSLRSSGLAVETATTGTDAWAILEQSTPDLVIAATALAGIDGFELCARLRRAQGAHTTPVILLATDKSLEQKMRILEVGADDYLVKPVYVKEVLARVASALQRRDRERLTTDAEVGGDRFAGSINDITVVDLVQLVEGNGRSGIVHLRSASGAPASIYFRHGRIVDAEVARLSGTDALSRLFSWTAGSFDFEWKSIRRKDAIGRPSAELVIEGMQQLDEWNRLIAQLPDPNALFEVDYRLLAERLAEIPDEVNEILRLCDGVRTVGQIVEDAALPDVAALSALIRLRDEGIVSDVSSRRSSPAATGSTRADGWRGTASPAPPPRVSVPARSGRLAMGSGPVQQSFAARLNDDDRNTGVPTAGASPADPDREAAGMGGPRRRRTAPGLGQGTAADVTASHATPEDDSAPSYPDAIPDPRASERNIIKFPTQGEPRAESIARSDGETDAPANPWLGAATAAARGPELNAGDGKGDAASGDPSGPPPVSEADAEALARAATPPRAPAPMVTTHRGFGPTARTELRADAGVPDEVLERTSGDVARDADAFESDRQSARNERELAWGRAGPASGSGPDTASVPEEGPTPDSSRSHGRAAGRDQTQQIRFPDDVSRSDALDELGLPSRWRGLRFLAGALVVGVVAAVAVRRLRIGTTDTSPGGRPAGARPPPTLVDPGPPPPAPAGLPASGAPASSAVALPAVEGAAAAGSKRAEASGPVAAEGAAVIAETAGGGPPPVAAPARPNPAEAAEPSAPPAAEPSGPPSAPPATPPSERASPSISEEASAPDAEPRRQLSDCRAAFMRGRMREALTACTGAVAANPGSADALTMLAHAELDRGRLTQANELAHKAIAINPNLADAYVIIGGVHQDSGQHSEAKSAYRRYLQLAPRGRYADELRSIVNSL